MVIDVQSGRTIALEAMGDIVEFTKRNFAPDGESVAFSGLREGQRDIYIYNLKTRELAQLTDEKYSDVQPSFSPDGKTIVFSTDRMPLESASRSVDIPMGMAMIDVSTKKVTILDVFPGANNLNRHFSGDGTYIYFLSNGDGYRNLFRYSINNGVVERLTDDF